MIPLLSMITIVYVNLVLLIEKGLLCICIFFLANFTLCLLNTKQVSYCAKVLFPIYRMVFPMFDNFLAFPNFP